jgi:TolA-binding protein
MYRHGEALASAQNYKAAAAKFSEFLTKYLERELAVAPAQQAIALSREKRFEEALRLLERISVEKLDPGLRSAALYERGWCLREMGKRNESLLVFRQLATDKESGPLRLHAMLELATQEAAAKHYDQAIKLFTQLRGELEKMESGEATSLTEQVVYRFGLCQFESGRFADASETLSEFAKAFEKSTMLGSANYYAGESFFKEKNYTRAAEHLDRALHGKHDEAFVPSALLRFGESEAQLQHWIKSEEAFDQYLQQFRDRDSWYQAEFGMGWARENQGRHDDAMKAYRKVVELHKGPTAARAQFQIGECLFAKKQYDEAVRELLKVDILYDYPEWSAAALYEAGRCFEKLARSGEARQQFRSVTEKYGDTQWAHLASQRLSELSASLTPGHSTD